MQQNNTKEDKVFVNMRLLVLFDKKLISLIVSKRSIVKSTKILGNTNLNQKRLVTIKN
ncbi:MAG: hypothetical protein K0S41_3805 [Anaerocolumna sp.]|jgi:hypothetical protein|nr:hypothetical protein [Anaerocolumna sp.]